jgi:hypothetical protein
MIAASNPAIVAARLSMRRGFLSLREMAVVRAGVPGRPHRL